MKKTLVIAEAGVNHNGSLSMARELIDAAVDAKVDVVKFQSFVASELVTKSAETARYQKQNVGGIKSQYELLKGLELSFDMQSELMAYAETRGVEFLSTAFDEPSLDFLLNSDRLKRLKIPSGEISNAPFLLRIARQKKPVILSTGASCLADIEKALAVLAYGFIETNREPIKDDFARAWLSQEGQNAISQYVTILHCTTSYPAAMHSINLLAMPQLGQTFGTAFGYSDHSQGISISLAAAALGATVVEKHFTLDRNLPGPDHLASLEPEELRCMVQGIREIDEALGSHQKKPTLGEIETSKLVRKSLVANRDIAIDHIYTEKDLSVKRPGTGRAPFDYWDLLGQKANRNYQKDELID